MRWLIEFATLACLTFAAWGAILDDLGCVLITGFGAAAFAVLGAFNRGTL